MRIGATLSNKRWPLIIVGLVSLLWTGYLYANFLSWLGILSWLGVEDGVGNVTYFVVMLLLWAIELGLMPLALWIVWGMVRQVRAFLVFYTLNFVGIMLLVLWLILRFEPPDSWTCLDKPYYEYLCAIWDVSLFMLSVPLLVFWGQEDTASHRDSILILHFTMVLNFNALPWIMNLHCGGFFLNENWLNILLFLCLFTYTPIVLMFSVLSAVRWRWQPLIGKWLIGGLLAISIIWFAMIAVAVLTIMFES